MTSNALKAEKLAEIKRELQETRLWLPGHHSRDTPAGECGVNDAEEFVGWLQGVCGQNQPVADPERKEYIVPQAVRVFGDHVNRGKLLQLLIELDAIL